MANTHLSKTQLRIQNTIFLLLFLSIIGLLAWLSVRYEVQSDWSDNNYNTLSEASSKLLSTLDQPIIIDAFVREGNLQREAIRDIFARYQRNKSDITLNFINPDTDPQRVRDEGISVEGELVIHYANKRENLQRVTEESVTNALQRLARSDERWIVFLSGHGERDPFGEANFHLGAWGEQLQKKGFKLHRANLSTLPEIPLNTAVLVIADPQTELLLGELAMVQLYVENGGNLLWMIEPEQLQNLTPLAEQLAIRPLSGTLVDSAGQLLGLTDPRFAIVSEYPNHPITAAMESVTLFPQTGGFEIIDGSDWQHSVILSTLERSWLEQDEILDVVNFDVERDHPGPIILGSAITRQQQDRQQRVVVVHDADFLSNTYIGNGGNIDLGLNIINWLSHDDRFIAIPAKTSQDNHLELTVTAQAIIGFAFLIVIPGLLLIAGIWIWLKRRAR